MIRVGIGGWDFDEWKGAFYPSGLKKDQALHFASRQLTAIEVNGTFYRTQNEAVFQKWAAETPDNFMFSLKAHRSATAKRQIGETSESIDFFINSGVLALGDKLGPIVWQMPPHKKLDLADMSAFVARLPQERGGRQLRHALEVRHETFKDPAFVELAAKAGVGIVFADSDDYPAIPDPTADFIYARLQRSEEDEATGYPAKGLDLWAKRAKEWEKGGTPDGLDLIGGGAVKAKARDVFVYFIAGAKVRNPAAAQALIAKLK